MDLEQLKNRQRTPHPRDALENMAKAIKDKGTVGKPGEAIWTLPKEGSNPDLSTPPK